MSIYDTPPIVAADYRDFLSSIEQDSVDLILTDPPYAISRETGFSSVGKNSVARFGVSMHFGKWDNQEIDLKALAELSMRSLRKGGTIIVFYDLWKITKLADALTDAGFKQLRFIEWEKTNPVPLNSKRNYLTNSREIAASAVKHSKPTFNSEYDNGKYLYPIHREKRIHPTQKPLKLLTDLVLKHSNVGDMVVDPFSGSGSTAIASLNNDRLFKGADIDIKYVGNSLKRLESIMRAKKQSKETKQRNKAKKQSKETKQRNKAKKQSKRELFIELAKPIKDGVSRVVPVTDFVGKYERLKMGNGGDWCRHDSKLAQEYNVVRNKEKGRIVSVQLNGFNKKPIKKTIKASIVKKIKQKRCVILHTSNPEVDHKNGRLDDPKSLNTSTQTMQDFQPLSKAANDAKRQHCKKCRKSGTRFDAASIGYPMSYYEGDAKHQGTCVGCYWYDPLEFRAKLKSI